MHAHAHIHTHAYTHARMHTHTHTSSPRAFSPLLQRAESDSVNANVEAGNIENISMIDTQI